MCQPVPSLNGQSRAINPSSSSITECQHQLRSRNQVNKRYLSGTVRHMSDACILNMLCLIPSVASTFCIRINGIRARPPAIHQGDYLKSFPVTTTAAITIDLDEESVSAKQPRASWDDSIRCCGCWRGDGGQRVTGSRLLRRSTGSSRQ